MPTVLIPHDTATGYVSVKSGIKSLGLASGLTGAAAASRYAGATASGAPASGTFLLGDWTIDQTGAIHVCTVSGTVGGAAVFTRVGGTAVTEVTFAQSTASPNDTVYVDSITAAGSTTNVDLALRPKGTGALTAHVADGTAAGGDKRGGHAVDWQRSRDSAGQVASADQSTIGGGYANTASGTDATVAGGRGNIATYNHAVVAGGWSNTGSSYRSSVGGGAGNTASGEASTIAGGHTNTATALMSTIPGGTKALAATYGKLAYASGMAVAQGDAQYGLSVLRGATTADATARLTSDGTAASATNVANLAANRCFLMKVLLAATDTASPHTVGLVAEYSVLIRQGAAAANTVVVDQTQHTLLADASLLATAIAITADTTNGGLNLTVTGIAGSNLRWVATIQTTEVG